VLPQLFAELHRPTKRQHHSLSVNLLSCIATVGVQKGKDQLCVCVGGTPLPEYVANSALSKQVNRDPC
jgi:hypothetical protein